MPWRWATAAASVRPRTSSLVRIRETCTLAVFSAMNRRSPISRFVAPAATSSSTCSSRGVSPNGVSSSTGGALSVGCSAPRRLSLARAASPSISPLSQYAPRRSAPAALSDSDAVAASRFERASCACAWRQRASATW